ncbi:MAG: InlB B-repeat-containing protein [Bacteroidaceae bacterium]|nr:InlB B-repeat-containing protein [Bacteroidaceae bacterium]
MKRIFSTLFAVVLALHAVAQLSGDGYYRIKNVGSQRYLYVTDNKGSINASSASADLGAVKLYRDFSNAVSDPATILYIKQSSSGYRFEAQGTDSHEIIGYDLLISAQSDGTYKAYQQQSFLRMYLCDARVENTAEGVLSTKDMSSSPTYQKWDITPVTATGSEYFGITPQLSYGGSHYATLYAAFPYTFASSGMTAYYVSVIESGVAVIAPVSGNAVPEGMPVVVKMSSTDPANNKLNIAANSATVPSDNKLAGVYFCNTSKAHSNVKAYDANTMRVLGLTSTGKLGFIKATNDMLVYDKNNKYYCLPANKAYLVVPAGTPDELEVMTKEEYDNRNVNVTATATAGGTVAGSGTYKANSQVTLTATAQAGYHFEKWSDGSTANPYTFTVTGNTSLTATFAPSSFQLVYMVDGVQHHAESVIYGTTLTALAAPSKEGHTFSGWTGLPATMPAGNVTVTGSFTPNTYQVSYVVDGDAYQTVSATYGSALTALAAPSKEGHTFSGWTGLPATMPAGNVTVTGSFSPNSYQLTYVVDGVSYHTESVVYGTMLIEIEEPVKEGHTFSGWTKLPTTMPAGDVTVTGSFEVNYYEFAHMLDGDVYKTEMVAYGSELVLEANPEKEGYTFSGWSEAPETMPAAKVVVTGSLIPNVYQVTYMVDGELYLIDSVTCDAPFKAQPVPVQAGYNFEGWDSVPATMPACDIVLSGTFVINKDNKFNLVYMLDGQEYKRTIVSFGDTLSVEPDPVKEGYTFCGWSELPETMPLQDVTVTGEFTVNYYLLTYVLDGETYQTDSVAYGERLVLPEVAEKEGYTFSGWDDAPKTMPFEDLTLSGEYLINHYLLTYVVDGEVYAQDSVAYGAPIVLMDDLVKEGYIFSGWSEVPETMPAANVKVLAIFTVDGIDDIVTDRLVDVYTLQGVRVKSQVPMEELQHELPRGIYIVNGRKLLVK